MEVSVDVLALVYQEDPPKVCESLTPLDITPLLLRTISCPAVKFDYPISFAQLRIAATALLEEYPVLGGRLQRLSHLDVMKAPYLKAAPYCISLAHPQSGLLLFEARAHCSSSDIDVAAQHSLMSRPQGYNSNLPPWYQPLDMSAVLRGREALLKIQLTHTSDGGSILTATVPQFLADGYSSALLLNRLAELYKQQMVKPVNPHPAEKARPMSPQSHSVEKPPRLVSHHSEKLPRITSPYAADKLPRIISSAGAHSADRLPRIHPSALSATELQSPWMFSPAGEDHYSNNHDATDEFVDPLNITRQDSGVSSNDSEAIVPMVSKRKPNTPRHPLSPMGSGKLPDAEIRAERVPSATSESVLSATVSTTMVSPRAFTSSISSHHKATGGRCIKVNLSAESLDRIAAGSPGAVHDGGYIPSGCGSTGSAEAGGPAGVAFCQLRASQDAAAIALVAEKASGKAWSKHLLMPKETAGSGTDVSQNQASSEALQAALRELLLPKKRSLAEMLQGQLRRLLSPVCCLSQTTVVSSKMLQIPQKDVDRLKAIAATTDASSKGITTSEVVSALLWMIMCETRGRPMPGSCSSHNNKGKSTAAMCNGTTKMAAAAGDNVASAEGYLGLSVNLRHECKDVAQRVPSYYIGNTASTMYLRCSSKDSIADNKKISSSVVADGVKSSSFTDRLAANICPAGPDETTKADAAVAESVESDQPGVVAGDDVTRSLQTATAAVRQGMMGFRAAGDAGNTLLQAMQEQSTSTTRWARSLARLESKVDAFINCQQPQTPTLDFGTGQPCQSTCLLQPALPWSAVVVPCQAAARDNVTVRLSVPDVAMEDLLHSSIVRHLVPDACFLG